MTAINDDELPPSPVRTLSAQRVAITMNPDGSIIKHKPPPPSALARQAAEAALDEELELDHPTVAAPVRGPELDTEEPVAPTSLQGLPIDTGAVAETAVMKDAVDDERTHEVTELGPGNYLNETKHIMNGVPKEDLWLLMRRFDKVCPCTTVLLHSTDHHRFEERTTCPSYRSEQEAARWQARSPHRR
jgi:hypothetical protein